MEWFPPLHAAHDARETLSELRLVSWAVIGLGIGALVLAWGRIIAWLRTPGHYFELRNANESEWTVEADGSRHALRASPGRTLMLRGELPEAALPTALHSSGGVRLPL
jgi:hypothetical protein